MNTTGKSHQNLRDRLGQWETNLAPLTERQKKSYMELSTTAASRPMPDNLPSETTTTKVRKEESQDMPGSLGLDKIESSQQFLAWFDKVDSLAQDEENKCYRDYMTQLTEYQDRCSDMLSEIDNAVEFLNEMSDKHTLVSQKTGALHQACEQLVEEQSKLVSVAESISSKLSYFTELEIVGQKLHSSSLAVTSDSFTSTLARLDQCIEFIQQNPQYKESQVYLVRFKQYLSRALGLVKQHVISSIKNTTKTVMLKQGVAPASIESTYAQYYGKFRTNAPKLKALMKEIEERVSRTPEYEMFLRDCHHCYVSQRGLLLTPVVAAHMEELKRTHISDNSGLVRSGCNYLCRVCQDEYQLFFHFFTAESQSLGGLLESLCFSLYDMLRPVIIHTNYLETLADLCTIFKVEMLEERVVPKGKELAAFGGVVKQMVEDTQHRLIFRAQRFIQTDIRGYRPAPGDLAYPDKLIVAAEATQAEKSTTDSDSVFETSGVEKPQKREAAVDMHAMWYPTVRRTLLCLSKLYRCIDKPVFEGIAHEALSECINSLISASSAIKDKKLIVDSQLFLIKHLLILREQIAPFDVNFAVTEVSLDWSKTRAAAYGLLHKRSRLFSLNSTNAILEFFIEGSPGIVETHLDSRKEVDKQLKLVCEKFINGTTDSIVEPLKTLLARFDVLISLASKDNLNLTTLIHQQPFAGADNVHEVVTKTNQLIKSRVPLTKKSLSLYLANDETEHILFRPCRANILKTFDNLEALIKEHYSAEDQYIISCPTQEEVSLMLALKSEQ